MFASVSGINAAISELWVDGLPENYYQQYGKAIDAVTKDDVVRVATKYIPIDRLAVVIVGDRTAIQKPLEAAKIAPIVLLDTDGVRVDGK